MKRCRICRTKFEPFNSLQVVCSRKCALDAARATQEKKADKEAKQRRKRDRERLEQLKPLSKLLKEAQLEFNAMIRERDRDSPCISCGTESAGQWHAGHFRSVGACPELRFEPMNCHKQCAQCNNFESGNILQYRKGLIRRYGVEQVDWIEGPHQTRNYTREEARELKARFREQKKRLQRSHNI